MLINYWMFYKMFDYMLNISENKIGCNFLTRLTIIHDFALIININKYLDGSMFFKFKHPPSSILSYPPSYI